ncbi:hypothetical protein [Noviherbaspirillum cavernae]|uniref:hypothetical protein n=1 Tax=Noviherbaspirillum cavernae TaxID=2320862 RepID=UPI001313E06B|nr:hypothetical protein [Noviherbaspirillum cavernae]
MPMSFSATGARHAAVAQRRRQLEKDDHDMELATISDMSSIGWFARLRSATSAHISAITMVMITEPDEWP